jgi:hypothetical protein
LQLAVEDLVKQLRGLLALENGGVVVDQEPALSRVAHRLSTHLAGNRDRLVLDPEDQAEGHPIGQRPADPTRLRVFEEELGDELALGLNVSPGGNDEERLLDPSPVCLFQ